MQITDVTFMRRKNLGNYEHEEISLTAKVDEGESPEKVLNLLDNTIRKQLGLPTVALEESVEEVKEAPKKKKVAKKVTKKKASTKKKEEAPKEEEAQVIPTFDELMVEMRAFCKAKGVNAAKVMLKEYGVEKAAELNKENYIEVMERIAKCLKK